MAGGDWMLKASSGTLLHFFEDGCSVFNPVRWETHVVDLLVGSILEQLTSGTKSEQELVGLAVTVSDLDRASATRFVEDAMIQLAGLEIVTRSPCHAHR